MSDTKVNDAEAKIAAINNNVTMINPFSIKPLHGVEKNDSEYVALRSSMRADGWVGRPLLICKSPKLSHAYQTLTGSHRVNAACECKETDTDGLNGRLCNIPCYVMKFGKLDDMIASADAWSDDDRLDIVCGEHDPIATALMEIEVAANAGNVIEWVQEVTA